MAILNFNFTKIAVEKKGKLSKEMKIQSKMGLIDVVSSEMASGSKQKAFVVKFNFTVNYEPNVGVIDLSGDLLYLADEKLSKEIEVAWKKNKSLPQSITLPVFNKILHNCNVEALILSKEIALPSPVQLPKVKVAPPKKDN